jgi:hypothetical protein
MREAAIVSAARTRIGKAYRGNDSQGWRALCKFSGTLAIVSLCLAQHVRADEISVTNQNCVFQGLSRTNQVNLNISIRVRGTKEVARDCYSRWIALGAGKTQVVHTPPLAECHYFWCKAGCDYTVEAEGVPILGDPGSKFTCSLNWLDVCVCKPL